MDQLSRDLFPETRQYPLKVLQFGGGNFLRAFTAWMVELLNEDQDFQGDIAVVKPTAQGNYATLKRQQGLYHVLLQGVEDGKQLARLKRIHCLREIVNPYTEWQDFLRLAESETLRYIISNTTEAGIAYDPNAAASDTPPHSFPAKLTLWFYHRFRHFKAAPERGCIVLPCELIESNGSNLKNHILRHAGEWRLGAGFEQWLSQHNTFCNTLVDRIVSGFPEQTAHKWMKQIGYWDELLVGGEDYHSWVIEADINPADIPFSQHPDLNVKLVSDLRPYREMKVRILNGLHTLMVPIGILMGYTYVHECMENEDFYKFLEQLASREIGLVLSLPEGEIAVFTSAVFARFQNPSLNHELMSISLNAMAKFRTRVLPGLLAYWELQSDLPARTLTGFAALLLYYRRAAEPDVVPLTDDPGVIGFFREVWTGFSTTGQDYEAVAVKVLENQELWGQNLNKVKGLAPSLGRSMRQIVSLGIGNTIKTITG